MLSVTPKSLVLFALVLPLMELETDAAALSSSSSSLSSLMEVLHNHGLPGGLFPQNVKSYDLDEMGRMEVHMDHPCLAEYETKVFFDSVVRANLSFGQLKVLEGMSREELFLWLPVKDIIVIDPSSGLIIIDIGLAYKLISLSKFEDPPICTPHDLSLGMGGKKGKGFNDQR